ncbi:MAG: DUF4152 family protein [Candidatus Bathyarchaeia archaeon]
MAADSGAALLNARFEPLQIVATAAVLVEAPYRNASRFLAERLFTAVENGHGLIINELELCQRMLKDLGETKADMIHLDMTMGGLLVEEISPIQLRGKARSNVLKILPKIRKLATDIKRVHGIDVLALGKESVPVRIAELTTGAHAILYTCEKVSKEDKAQILGLPSKCYARITEKEVILHSLIAAEHDVVGYAEDDQSFLKGVQIREILNPCARGFRALKIVPRKEG